MVVSMVTFGLQVLASLETVAVDGQKLVVAAVVAVRLSDFWSAMRLLLWLLLLLLLMQLRLPHQFLLLPLLLC